MLLYLYVVVYLQMTQHYLHAINILITNLCITFIIELFSHII